MRIESQKLRKIKDKDIIKLITGKIWYQEVDTLDSDADFITNFDFDNNWYGVDNWQNQSNNNFHPLKAYIYYSQFLFSVKGEFEEARKKIDMARYLDPLSLLAMSI